MSALALLVALATTQTSTPTSPLRRLDHDRPVVAADALRAPPGIHANHAPEDDGRTILGEDERQKVERVVSRTRTLEGHVDFGEAFARFGPCTATHVGRGFFLTAGHCISQDPGFEGYRSAPCPETLELFDGRKVGCRVLTFAFDVSQDHALLRADKPDELAELPAFPIDYSFDWRRTPKRRVMLYGLSRDELRVNLDCIAEYERPRNRILHDCDTEGGDSGSALIDRHTEHIIGVHGGGSPKDAKNYAWPIEQVPWAETLCVALGSSSRLEVVPGMRPVRLRVSTSKMDGDFTRLVVDLDGRLDNRDLKLRVLAPDADEEVAPQTIRWSSPTRWWWKDLFILENRRRGPWAVEVSSTAPRGTPRNGYVRGKIWVCP